MPPSQASSVAWSQSERFAVSLDAVSALVLGPQQPKLVYCILLKLSVSLEHAMP